MTKGNKQFLKHLSKSHEDRQVNQADHALRLYGYFLSLAQKKSLKDTSDVTEEWRLLEAKTRDALRLRHRSYSTKKTYLSWLRRFMVFVHGKDPAELGGGELQDYLSYLAVERHVSPSTQNQALNAIVFFYRHILEKNIDNELSAVRAKQRRHLPVVHSVKEI